MNLPAELEAAIVEAPDDRDVYRVAGDWLQQQGSPQGELVALQLAKHESDRIAQLKHAVLPPELRENCPLTFEWRWGFVRGVLVTGGDARMLRDFLASPLARFVQKIALQGGARLAETVFEIAPRCLRTLMLFLDGALELDRLVKLPLRRLVVRAQTTGRLDLPLLEELVVDHDKQTTKLVAESALPKLERLQLDFGDVSDRYPPRWIAPDYYPALRRLSLSHQQPPFGTWRRAPIAEQLDLLDFVAVRPGMPGERQLIVDRTTRSNSAGLLVLVGRDPSPGTWLPIDALPFVVPAKKRAEVHRFAHGYVLVGDELFLHGRFMTSIDLRTLDEVAVGDHVFRFIEADNAPAIADEQRSRYAL